MSLFCLFSGTTGTTGSIVWLVQAQETKIYKVSNVGQRLRERNPHNAKKLSMQAPKAGSKEACSSNRRVPVGNLSTE
jgi:hypothetical protein